MDFRTPIGEISITDTYRYEDKYVFIGSCFSESISACMKQAYMQVCVNPFGIMYNPLSIAECMKWLFNDNLFTENDLVYYDGLYHSMLHHGEFSSISKDDTLNLINQRLNDARTFIRQTNNSERIHFIFTFGTAYVYEQNGQIVANCHKIPARQFDRRLLTIKEIYDTWNDILRRYFANDNSKTCLFTISPIRHLKDGLHNNQLSKSTLLLTVSQLPNANYFPSYEIMMDDLRDYRFYADDMLHPSSGAVKYIWEQFVANCFTESEQQKIVEAQAVYNLMNHKIMHDQTPQAKQFEITKHQKFNNLKLKYPWIKNY